MDSALALGIGAVMIAVALVVAWATRQLRALRAPLLRASVRLLTRALPTLMLVAVIGISIMGLGLMLALIQSAAHFWRSLW